MNQQSPMAPRNFHILAKPAGPACNMACDYCYYLEKERLFPPRPALSDWFLPEAVLEQFIRQYIESQPSGMVSFSWQGGEPTLLGSDYFRKAVELQRRHANGKQIENTFQTNGILLDDRWCEFLAENRFLVGLSIDGPRLLHDCYRKDKRGGPSFDRVLHACALLKKHRVEFNTLTVVHKQNSRHATEIYRFLKEIGSGFMQFIPVVERIPGKPARVTDSSVDPMQYGRFLCAVFDDWVVHDVGKVFVQLFDVTLEAWVGVEPSLCIFQRTCGSAAVMEHNGDIYSCDHYVYPENRLGNVMDQPLQSIMNSPEQIRFGLQKLDRLPERCRKCRFLFACNGGCPKHRFVGEENMNYLCPGYSLFFSRTARHMELMATEIRAGRPAANIMSLTNAPQRVGRNDPCPCGSGLKFKRCCG